MPTTEETDSGVEAMSASGSREDSPSKKIEDELDLLTTKDLQDSMTAELKESMVSNLQDDDDDEDIDETLAERLWGLTEMFPVCVRNFTSNMASISASGVKNMYGLGRCVLWIFFSSSAILFAPVIFEAERSNMEEVYRQQQRQMLFGPSAAVTGGMPNLGMPMPQMSQPQR